MPPWPSPPFKGAPRGPWLSGEQTPGARVVPRLGAIDTRAAKGTEMRARGRRTLGPFAGLGARRAAKGECSSSHFSQTGVFHQKKKQIDLFPQCFEGSRWEIVTLTPRRHGRTRTPERDGVSRASGFPRRPRIRGNRLMTVKTNRPGSFQQGWGGRSFSSREGLTNSIPFTCTNILRAARHIQALLYST